LLDTIERHHILLFFIVPAMMLTGIVFAPLAMVVVAIGVGYLFYHDKHDSIIFLFVLVLLMGDSRSMSLQFFKSLRIEILIFLFIFTLYELRNNLYRTNALLLYFVPFFWVSLLSLIFSPTMPTALSKTLSFALLYFVGFNYLHHKIERYGIQLMIDIYQLCLFLTVIGFFFIPIIPELVTYGGVRYNGMMGNPNGLGMFVTLLSPLAYYLFKRDRNFTARHKLFAWTVIMISLLMCSSRNAIFSVALFFMLVFGLEGSTFRRVSFLYIILPGLAFLIYNVDLESLVYSLGLESYFRIKEFGSGSGRIFAWGHAIELIKKSPFIGCGFACEEYSFIEKLTFQLWHSGHQGGVHNSYLAYTVNTGFAGLICYFGFLFNAARKVRNKRILYPFMAAVLLSAMFESWLNSSLSAFQIMFLMILIFFIVDTNREELLVSSVANDFSNKAVEGMVR
jgi:O-antigen ligase